MANTRAIWQYTAHTTYQLFFLSRSTKAIPPKGNLLKKNVGNVFEKKSREWTISRKIKERALFFRKGKDETEKQNQMTTLRFQTGGKH